MVARHRERQGDGATMADITERLGFIRGSWTTRGLRSDPRAGRERYWLRCRAPFPFRWLRVVVEFTGDADRVVTAFGQDNDPEDLPR